MGLFDPITTNINLIYHIFLAGQPRWASSRLEIFIKARRPYSYDKVAASKWHIWKHNYTYKFCIDR